MMKTLAIATLLGLFLSTSALASDSGCEQQVKNSPSNAANSYIYINRIASPSDKNSHNVPAKRLSGQR